MGNAAGGCLGILVALVVIGLLVGGCVYYIDDVIGIQVTKAKASLAQAEADARWAEAERTRAEADLEQTRAVRDVTGAVANRMNMVNLVPWIPVLVILVILSPMAGYVIGEWWPRR